jgi:para-aminobenzoate synthetase / 4-amino-4-deoxychorismate lyase
VAAVGSVAWSDVFELERYETVWQLTSTVSANARPDAGVVHVFRALFPCGSVTGAPKVRTMQIISELEDSPRGVYCGAVGYLAPPSSGAPAACFNVPIRTVVVDTETHTAEYGVGGGITWDSRAEGEYDETVAKARVLTERRPRFELFETLRHDPGAGFLHLDRHLARISGSAAYFGFGYDEQMLVDALGREAARFPEVPARIRMALDRRGDVTTGAVPLPVYPDRIRVALDTTHPVDPSDPMLFHKTSLRRRYEEARERHPDAEDVLLTNVRGEVTESTIANVAVRHRAADPWRTPPIGAGLLAGVGRQVALDAGELEEAPVSVQDLRDAAEVALVSDVRGWRRVELTG